jgi:hypothetical protein
MAGGHCGGEKLGAFPNPKPYGIAVLKPFANYVPLPYIDAAMHTVVETDSYLRDAKTAGMSEDERNAAVDLVATDPEAGDMMQGTGGVRKARLAGRGKGKSGGYRLVYYFGGGDIPVYLLTVFGKGEKANLTQGEKNALKSLTASLTSSAKST